MELRNYFGGRQWGVFGQTEPHPASPKGRGVTIVSSGYWLCGRHWWDSDFDTIDSILTVQVFHLLSFSLLLDEFDPLQSLLDQNFVKSLALIPI